MTIDYLVRTKSVKLNNIGQGVITLAPDTGEYWAPSFVRVATSGSTKQPHAYLYQGAIGIRDTTTFQDDTIFGNGDVSSIPVGTIVQRGEAITVQWVDGQFGDIATVTLYGRSANTLPEIASVLGLIPGARFQGSSKFIDVNSLLLNSTGFAPGANSSVTSAIFDVSGAQGLYLSVLSNSNFPAKVTLNITKTDTSSFVTVYPISEFIIAGLAPIPVDIIVPVVFPTVSLTITAPTANGTAVVVTMWTSPVQQSGMPLVQNDINVIMSRTNIAAGAGATINFDTLRTWPGNAAWSIDTNIATWEASLQYSDIDGGMHNFARLRRAATGDANTRVLLPAAPIRLAFINTSGAAGAFNSYLVGQPVDGNF